MTVRARAAAVARLGRARLLEYGGWLCAAGAVSALSAWAGWTDRSLTLWAAFADLFAQFAPQGALLALALAGLARMAGRRWVAWAFVVAAAAMIAPTVAWLRPWPSSALVSSAAAPSFTLRFSNIYHLNRDVAAMAELFADPTVDVVAVVEATAAVQALLEPFAAAWPHRLGCAKPGACTNIIYSRHPLTPDSRVVSFSAPPGFHALEAKIAPASGAPLRLIVVHLARGLPYGGYKLSAQQADALARLVGPDPQRTLVVGDFNAAPWTRAVRRVTAPTGLVPAPGAEGTWPSDLPPPLRLWLDHALFSPDLAKRAERQLGSSLGSDHLSLRLQFAQ